MNKRSLIILNILIVYFVWGSTFLAIRYALESISPLMIGTLRFLSAGIILLFYLKIRGCEEMKPVYWRSAFIVGFFLLFIGGGSVYWAELYVPSGLTALIVSCAPLTMVLIDWIRPGGKYPTHPVFIAIIIGLIGILFLFAGDVLPDKTPNAYAGMIVLIAATFCWSGGSIYARSIPLPKSSLLTGAMEMITAGLVFLLASAFTGDLFIDWSEVTLKSWLAAIYLSVFGSIAAYNAFVWLLHNTTPALASTHSYINPVVALFLGWYLASEPITKHTIVGSCIIIICVIIITLYSPHLKKKDPSHPKTTD
ncbi:MAG: EamA family transporter [bacterium]|nr:EamA family transporter [bacterium]